MEKLHLLYLKVNSAKSYSFYMIPRELIDNPIFYSVDYGSKLLYSLMLNRASLSASNHDFIDDKGNIFIIYTVEQVNDINIIPSGTGTNENDISKIKKGIAENISLDILLKNNPTKQNEITELYELILDTMFSRKKTFRIAKEELNAQIVKETFVKLDYTILQYVLECLKRIPPMSQAQNHIFSLPSIMLLKRLIINIHLRFSMICR